MRHRANAVLLLTREFRLCVCVCAVYEFACEFCHANRSFEAHKMLVNCATGYPLFFRRAISLHTHTKRMDMHGMDEYDIRAGKQRRIQKLFNVINILNMFLYKRLRLARSI